ncbi:TP901 family phage tail tape measure protein [Planifilum fimeticola]|uniref:TP901 family phage tail tape measure protein n=1 Tax=Planifilum fimeticola TaxID=201975 RepID=A0A2T0LC48_9BACL|nr:phage tail tape measure protein [Planifilum fimeticola]PRX39524.1 TP901 family phage tail tape measure protein [Planifilum fimeticola]
MAEEILGRIKGEVVLDSQGFNQAVSRINQQLRLLKSEFDASAAKVKAFGKSEDQLRLQSQLLGRQIDLQKQKVSLLAQAHQQTVEKLGAESKQAQRLETQLNKARAALINMQAAHQRLNGQLGSSSQLHQRLTHSLDQLDQKMRLAHSEYQAAEAKARAFGNANDLARVKIGNLQQQIELQRKKVSLLSLAYKDAARNLGQNAQATQEAAIRLNEARATLANLEGSLRQLTGQLNRQGPLWTRFRQNLFHVREQAIDTGIALGVMSAAFSVAFGSAVYKAADFEAQLSSVKAVTGASAQEMERFKQLALELGAETKYSAAEAAQGIEELAKAGVSTAKILDGGLAGALNLAAAGEIDLAEAAQIASTVLNAFRKDNLSVAQAADILAGAANASATDIKELNYGLSQVSAVASSAGLSFRDTAAALAVFAQNGLKGSDAGTSLKTMLLNLTPSSKSAAKEMKRLGIITADGRNQFFDAHGRVKSFAEIAEILRRQLRNLSDEQRNQALKTMFGTDAVRAATIAFKEGASGVKRMIREMSKTTAMEVAQTRMDNLKGTVEELKGAFETFQIQMGSAFLPILRKAAEGLKGVVEWFSDLNPTTKEAIGIFASVTAGMLGLGAAVAGIIAISNPFTAAVVGGAVALGTFSAGAYKASKDMEQMEKDAIRFGRGVSEGTKQAARGFLDLRDQALVNLAKLRTATGAEAQKIVDETVAIFSQMGDKITAELNQDKINIQKAAASLLEQVPKALEPAVEGVTDTAIKAIDSQIKRIQEANKIIREGLVEFGGDVSKMPKEFAEAYNQALKDVDQGAQTFVKRVGDLNNFMETIQANQGKITAEGAQKWVKEIEGAYQKAIKAAEKWAKNQRKTWEEAFANGQITKEQYDMILKIVEAGEQDLIATAKSKRAEALKTLQDSLSEEAYLYDVHTGKIIKSQSQLIGDIESLNKQRGKKIWDAFFEEGIESSEKTQNELKSRMEKLIKEYGDIGAQSVEGFAATIRKGGKKARIAAEFLAVETRDGFKIDLGPEGLISINSFIKGLQSGQYTARDVAIAHMNQLRNVYGAGRFTPEGIKAIESFVEGLRSKDPAEIADKIGLDLKSKMKIDLGRYGQMTAQSFAEGLSNGTLGFDAVYAYFRTQIKNGMKVDLSAEGKQNIQTLRFGMQTGAIDVVEAAADLGLDIKSKAKVDLGAEGQFTVKTLLQGLSSGKISVEQFAKGVQFLLKNGAKTNLTPEGKAAGTSMAKGLNASKPNVIKAAGELKGTTTKTLASATDGGGGRKVGSEFQRGIASKKAGAAKAASSVASGAKSNLKVSGVHGLGASVSTGFAAGILSGKYGVIDAAKQIARAAMNAIKRALDSRSPSREMMKIGVFAAQGYEEGMRKRLPHVQRVAEMLSQTTLNQLQTRTSTQTSQMTANTSRPVINRIYNITVNGAANPVGTQREVIRAIQNLERLA